MKGIVALGATLAVVMAGGAGTASAACTTDESSGEDARTGQQIPPGGTSLGAGYLDVTGAPNSGSGSIVGFLGYAEWSGQLSGTSVSTSGESNGTGVGYIENDVSVNGTTVSGGIDGSGGNGAVSGSGELNGTTVSDVEANGVCLTP